MRALVLADATTTDALAAELQPRGWTITRVTSAAEVTAALPADLVLVERRALDDDPAWRALAVNGNAALFVADAVGLLAHARSLATTAPLGPKPSDFDALVDLLPDGLFTLRLDDHEIVYANQALASLLGYDSPSDLIGRTPLAFLHPEEHAIARERIAALGRPPFKTQPATLRFLGRDGSVRYAETRGIRVSVGDAVAGTVLVRDQTARRTAEEALKRSEDRFVKFFHVNPACATVTRLSDNIFVDVNERFCQLTGFSREELLGRTGVSVGLWLDPTERARIERQIRAVGRVQDVEVRLRKKSGQPLDVRMSLETFALGGVDCVFALSHDVTERKQLEAQLRQAQKMDAVGRLAGGIAHDFNNLLTAIRGYSEMLSTTLAPDTRPHDAAMHIHRSSLRASSLTEQLLVFTRRRPQESRVVQLNDVVTSMASMLRRLLGEDLELVLQLTPAIGRVRIDPTQLEQVLLNLAVNARDAMPRGGRLTIETRESADREGRTGVLLLVRDTGGGIDDATRPHIFEPFFTTKEIGKGTGLGLSIVYGVVTQAGGQISVESAPGQGAAFRIWLPRVDDATPQPAPTTPLPRSGPGGGETILLVEDDEDVRDYVRFVLRQAGYQVLDAIDGGGGLRVLENYSGEIHLVLSDIVMPEMSGPEMATRAQALRPQMKVLHMSGYPGDSVTRHAQVSAAAAFLQKPFSAETLTRAVRAALDG
ncbi:MAG TPA: PAS domain S-box protein [Polyangia bacterium]|nr:PAS domain S-box protein [Polyangia bacterium]